jgi:hypothetical protein
VVGRERGIEGGGGKERERDREDLGVDIRIANKESCNQNFGNVEDAHLCSLGHYQPHTPPGEFLTSHPTVHTHIHE